MKKLMLCFSLLMLCLGACKKDKPTQSLETKILGKWSWVRFQDYHEPANANTDEDINPMTAGSFIEFLNQPDNNLVYGPNGGVNPNTYSWTKIDDNSFTMSIYPGITQKILISTNTDLVFYSEQIDNGVKHIIKHTLTKSP